MQRIFSRFLILAVLFGPVLFPSVAAAQINDVPSSDTVLGDVSSRGSGSLGGGYRVSDIIRINKNNISMNKNQLLAYRLFFGGLFCVLSGAIGSLAYGAEQLPATLTCTPDLPSDTLRAEQFTFAAGRTLAINCTARSTAAGDVSALLLGKQTDTQNKLSASGADMILTSDTPAQATLSFPAAFQRGNYRYSITLLDTKTHQPIAEEVTLVGVIEGDEQARILSLALEKEQYEWQAPATLSLSVTLPENKSLETSPLSLGISMNDALGATCQTLVADTPVKQVTDAYAFQFPGPGVCANTLQIVLKNQAGTVIDERVLAVGLPDVAVPTPSSNQSESTQPSMSSALSRPLIIGLVLTGIVFLAIGALALARKRK